MRKRLIGVWLLAAAFQAGAALAAFEDLGAGARAPGMGNAFVAIADDVYAIYYNPAGLGLLERPQIGTSYSKLHLGLSDKSDLATSFISYAQPLGEGRKGALGTAWNSFSLNNSLYREEQFYLSYGRQVISHLRWGELYGGISLKYLRSSFGNLAEASNAYNGIALTGQADPALSKKSMGAFDADLGALYRFGKHYSAGLQLTHLPQPNVAFNSNETDRLPLGVKLGLNYRSLISNLGLEVNNQGSATGDRDNTYTVAAERWFPRLFVGDFGVRGGLGLGSRDYRSLSLGLSYRSRRLGVDYAFALPINTVASTMGTHRFAFTFRFGRTTDEEESLELVLEAMRTLKVREHAALKAPATGLSPVQKATLEALLAQTRTLELTARFKDALEKMSQALGAAPADRDLVDRFGRLNFVGQQIPVLPEFKSDPLQARLHQGLLAYLSGKYQEAVEEVSQALALKPDYKELDVFLSQLERVTGVKRLAIAPQPQGYQLEALITQAESAIQEGRYDEAVELSLKALRLDPESSSVWQNLGTSYFALKDFDNSLKAWEKAYHYEKSPAIRTAIKSYIKSIQRVKRREPRLPRQALSIPERLGISPQEIQALYERGIDHYTKREFEKAREAFETILQADPENLEAQKALRRVKDELK